MLVFVAFLLGFFLGVLAVPVGSYYMTKLLAAMKAYEEWEDRKGVEKDVL